MRILGIDYGDKKIGLAFGDSSARVAVPLEVIRNEGEVTMRDLMCRIQKEDIDRVVVGVPLPQGNHSGVQLEKTRRFIVALASVVKVPVVEEDESFTSVESIRMQMEDQAQADEDALAAMLIVQSYIDQLPLENNIELPVVSNIEL
ncbi:MAG: Holliday junction resolvase RuvX [Candidatus Uhrbacteria bacterium]|nr:Holliday junction resolvase RuvX [Candidatus Uhrbacteria bacterium]